MLEYTISMLVINSKQHLVTEMLRRGVANIVIEAKVAAKEILFTGTLKQ